MLPKPDLTSEAGAQEADRLRALQRYAILDSPEERVFSDATFLAALVCATPIALVSFVDKTRQWFKAKVGLDITETQREHAFCSHAILSDAQLVVEDARADSRFASHPLVRDEPALRFYAGSPLVLPTGERLGTLCVLDRAPRRLEWQRLVALDVLARQVVAQLELRQHARLLRAEALADPLTSLANRRAFEARLRDECYRARRYKAPLALVLLDLDRFKQLNDSKGHPVGDETLRRVADALAAQVRSADLVARVGGDEFALVLPSTRRDAALALARRLGVAIEATAAREARITASIGVACVDTRDADADRLYAAADRALYRAKHSGPNRVVVDDEGMRSRGGS